MIALLRFIAGNAWLLSLFCLLGAVRYGWQAFHIYRVSRITPYTLERESALGQMRRAWRMATGLAAMSLIVLGVSPLVLQSTADWVSEATPTPVAGIFTRTPGPSATPTAMPPTPVETPTPTPGAVWPVATAMPTASPAPTVTATALPVPPNCPDPQVQITAPTSGQLLAGVVEIHGTANIPDFGFYKFEISGPLTGGEWRTIGEVARTPVSNGLLGYWDAWPVAREAPGLYWLRLVVVDRTGNYPAPCVIQVRIALE